MLATVLTKQTPYKASLFIIYLFSLHQLPFLVARLSILIALFQQTLAHIYSKNMPVLSFKD